MSMRYSMEETKERLRKFAENPDMLLPIHKDREFGLKILQKRFHRMIVLLFSFFFLLLGVFFFTIKIRYSIVINRIDREIQYKQLVYNTFNETKKFLGTQKIVLPESPDNFHWYYLKIEESFRGATVISTRKNNPFGLPQRSVIIALAPQLVDSGSTWYYKVRDRAEEVRNCALFICILHEIVHHKTGSHEEALKQEMILLSDPPSLQSGNITSDDWKEAAKVILEFIRGI